MKTRPRTKQKFASSNGLAFRNNKAILGSFLAFLSFGLFFAGANAALIKCLNFQSQWKSTSFQESCWTKQGDAFDSDSGHVVLGNDSSVGSILAPLDADDRMFQTNNDWKLRFGFRVSYHGLQPASSSASVVLSQKLTDSYANFETGTSAEPDFVGFRIIFGVDLGGTNKTSLLKLRSVAGSANLIDEQSAPITTKTERSNQTCFEEAVFDLSTQFALTIHKLDNKIYVHVKAKDTTIDCDLYFSVAPLMALYRDKRLPALRLGVVGWAQSATMALEKFSSDIRRVGASSEEEDFAFSESVKNKPETPVSKSSSSDNDDYDDPHDIAKSVKSVVVGSCILLGLVGTVGVIGFVWICKCDFINGCKRRNKRTRNDEAMKPLPPMPRGMPPRQHSLWNSSTESVNNEEMQTTSLMTIHHIEEEEIVEMRHQPHELSPIQEQLDSARSTPKPNRRTSWPWHNKSHSFDVRRE